MTGYSVRGTRGFVAKEGVTFDSRLNILLHRDERDAIRRMKREGESEADYVRAAIREKLLRDTGGKR